jgi:DNA-binding NarL/FixJ family response regulator
MDSQNWSTVVREPVVGGQCLLKRPRVLIADDAPGVAEAVSWLLRALDCEVVGTVADGRAVLSAVQSLQPDVILVDLNLPNVNGLEACRQIIQVNPDAKVIVFSASNDPDLAQLALEAGASASVFKGSHDLISTIESLCADRTIAESAGGIP